MMLLMTGFLMLFLAGFFLCAAFAGGSSEDPRLPRARGS
jgi:hypothetical protein